MVNERDKLKHDCTLALYILNKLSDTTLISILNNNFPIETTSFLTDLKKIADSDEANMAATILLLVNGFKKSCCSHKKLKEEERTNIDLHINAVSNELEEVTKNCEQYNIQLQCALDGYTLNRTCHLIGCIEDFMKKHPKASFLSEKKETQSAFYKNALGHEEIIKTLIFAEDLKKTCEQIRKQIGSPDSMPKGLVINFMVALCDAIRNCKGTDLEDHIQNEIKNLRDLYPELAAAGEELQESYCKFSVSIIK